MGLSQDTETWFCEEDKGSLKCGKFPDKLRTSKLLKKNFAQWSYVVI
jgi:hypothetical protein